MRNPRYLPLIATVAIFIVAYALCVLQFPNMLSTRVIGNLLTDNAFLGIAAVGMTFVILSGGIDLSIGSVIAFTGVFLAVVLEGTSIHPLLAFALAMLVVFALGIVIAQRTRFGANVYALGGGAGTAQLMGVPVARTTIAIYALSGFLAGLSGIVFSLYTSAGYSLAAVGVELDAIAAVVIGGTLLTGGSGFVAGTLVGILIQGLIQTYITFDGTLSSWWTKIVIGLLLFGFILMQKGLLYLSENGRRYA